MRCPFPGMDPYLEHPGIWEDFHHAFITHVKEQLAGNSTDSYDFRANEEVRIIAAEPVEPRSLKPDVAVVFDRTVPRSGFRSEGGAAVLEAPEVDLGEIEWTEVRHSWLEVRRLPDRELIAIIELLSPWNKVGMGYAEFCAKRAAALRRGVHWVELDLLVGGERTPLAQPRPPGDFYALVVRGERPGKAKVHAWGIRDRLPTIPIPLRAPDPDLPLDLAQAFAETYERSRLDKALRGLYPQPPIAAFADADRQWAAGCAASA